MYVLACKYKLCCIVCYSWRPPRCVLKRSPQQHEEIRQKWHILTEGEDPPPPIKTFRVHTPQFLLTFYVT